MGNDVLNLKKDLIDLDIEELRINRELYNLQLQINAKLEKKKKVRIKNNYKQIVEEKLIALEEKKRLLFEKENNKNNNKISTETSNNPLIYNIIETGDSINEEIKNSNREDNKLNLVSNSSKDNKKNSNINKIDKEYYDKKKQDNNNIKKEMISSSESEIKITTIYTKKKCNKVKINEQKEEIKNYKDDGDIKNNDDRNINDRYDKNNNNAIKENLDENLNINEYKRKFFDRLSSIGPKSNINKSMDNKNSSIIEELEVVGLSQNEILKDKLSEFFVGTSIGSSSISNQNNSSMHNNYHKNRPKSEISGVNRELISSSKSNNEDVKGINSINYKSINGNNEEREKKMIQEGVDKNMIQKKLLITMKQEEIQMKSIRKIMGKI